jgi:hypothetical protein
MAYLAACRVARETRTMPDFAFASDEIALPKGAWAKAHRHRLRLGGQTVLALTQGDFRSYVHPLVTPAGYAVTAESPADHPHHSGIWCAADHVHMLMPAAGGTVEEYTYNFYVGETFQGRAPGRIAETAVTGRPNGTGFEIVQDLEWRGPPEWAAPSGRCVARERRTLAIESGPTRHRIDVTSDLTAADNALKLGPTRHAYFNVRIADSMTVSNGGTLRDDRGHSGGGAVSGEGARWVDATGPVGGGHVAGVTVIPRPDGRAPFWFAADWGVVSVGPFRTEALHLAPGETFRSRHRVLVHDGEPDIAEIERIAAE